MDARAALIWCASALGVVFVFHDPLVDVLITLSAACVAARSEDALAFRTLVTVGLIAGVFRTAMFALTGHDGQVLLSLPQISLPFGLTIGGAVTAEVLIASGVEAVHLLTVLACLGALLSMVPTIELLRLLPHRLRDAGLVLNIAVAFAPQVVRSARDIRDARWGRGGSRKTLASIPALLVPVVATATERSIALAEAMDSRGYGRRATRHPTRLHRRHWDVSDLVAALTSTSALVVAVAASRFIDTPAATQGSPVAPFVALLIATSFCFPAFLRRPA